MQWRGLWKFFYMCSQWLQQTWLIFVTLSFSALYIIFIYFFKHIYELRFYFFLFHSICTHWVGPSFAFTVDLVLFGIDSTWSSKHSSEILVHINMTWQLVWICCLHIHDVKLLFRHITEVLYWIEIWRPWRPAEHSKLIVIYKKPAWDYLSSVIWCVICWKQPRKDGYIVVIKEWTWCAMIHW